MDAFKVIDLRGAPPAFQNQLDRMTEAPTFKVRIVNVKARPGWRILVDYGGWQEWTVVCRPDLVNWQFRHYRSRIMPPDFLTQRFMVTR